MTEDRWRDRLLRNYRRRACLLTAKISRLHLKRWFQVLMWYFCIAIELVFIFFCIILLACIRYMLMFKDSCLVGEFVFASIYLFTWVPIPSTWSYSFWVKKCWLWPGLSDFRLDLYESCLFLKCFFPPLMKK